MTYSNQLKHYGVKGQTWGVRKYQYEDGTYTPAGKERYFGNNSKSSASSSSRGKNTSPSSNQKTVTTTNRTTGAKTSGVNYSYYNSSATSRLYNSKNKFNETPDKNTDNKKVTKTNFAGNGTSGKSGKSGSGKSKKSEEEKAAEKAAKEAEKERKKAEKEAEREAKKKASAASKSDKAEKKNKKTEKNEPVDPIDADENLSGREKKMYKEIRDILEKTGKSFETYYKNNVFDDIFNKYFPSDLDEDEKNVIKKKVMKYYKLEHGEASIGEYYAVTYSNSLSHHGIKGQKWGIRRYQNYDGSYTQAGLRRYRVAESNYEYSKEKYKKAKAEYKNRLKNGYSDKELEETRKNLSTALYKGPNGLERGTKDYYKTASKSYLKNFKLGSERRNVERARAEMREDRRTRNKYYRHLHDDYMADKGKQRYARGERISTRGEMLANIAVGASAAVMLMKHRGVYRRSVLKATAALAFGSATAYTLINTYAELPMGNNAQLRKYYSHKGLPDLKDKTKSSNGSSPKNNLSTRFDRALKDNPDLTYDKIYKEMKVDMNSEDASTYKQAEDEWLKKHGY